MADRIEIKQVTVPAGTAETAAITTALPFQAGTVVRLEVTIPPGPSGLTGFQILHSGQRIIPFRDDAWIIADNERLDWQLARYPTGGAWAVRAYNTDIYPHTIYLRFHIDEFRAAEATVVTIVAIEEQSQAEDDDELSAEDAAMVFADIDGQGEGEGVAG